MKILVISQFFDPENFRINDLVEELDKRGNEITVLTGLPNYPEGKFYEGYSYTALGESFRGNVRIIRVPVIPRFSGKKIQLTINYLSFAFFASFIGIFFLRKRHDLIFTYAPSPLTVALASIFINFFKRIPHVIWVQDLWPEVFKAVEAPKAKLFYSTVEYMMKFIYRRSNLILIQSRQFKENIKKLGVEDQKIKYFPNWAEDFFVPIERSLALKEGYKLPNENSFTVMFAGNIGAAQCFDIIIEAALYLKDENIKWVILGDGRKRLWLEDQIRINSLESVMFTLGNKPVHEMPFYYSLADVMLVSLKPHPVFSAWIPGKIQSYLACAKPTIALLSGEGAKVIEESNGGYAVTTGTCDELIAQLRRIKSHSERDLLKMGQNALKYYNKEFRRERLISELESMLKEHLTLS